DLNAYSGQANVMVVFQNRGHYAQPLYIDNINITGTSTTSVDALNEAYQLTLSPNPTSGNLDLNFNSFEAADLNVEISNVLGQTINKELIKNANGNVRHTIDLSNQHAGVYFV